jgi:hypothetical protein
MIFRDIEQGLKNAAQEKAKEIAHGNAESFSQYKEECGIIKGLNMATYIAEDIIRKHIDEEQKDV